MSDLRRLIRNDTYLSNLSKNDSSLITPQRSPSLIIAAGTAEGSTANTFVETLNSTIIDGALDSDTTFYSPNATLQNSIFSKEDELDKRLSTEDEYTDCETSPHWQAKDNIDTSTVDSRLNESQRFHSENNNIIFKETNKSTISQVSENSDSGMESNAVSTSLTQFADLPPFLRQLTTILEESTVLSNINSERFSGVELISLIENLRTGPMPDLPKTDKFNKTFTTLAQILNKTSKEITIDQVAKVLLYTLQNDYSYPSEHLGESDSYFSYVEASKLTEIDTDNSGMAVDSIMRQLRRIHNQDKKIENESSPEWPSCLTSSEMSQNILRGRKKEYFPLSPFLMRDNNKEKHNFQENSHRNTVIVSPKKKVVRFSSENCQSSNLNKSNKKTERKKYFATPRFKQNKEVSRKSMGKNPVSDNEDSFLFWERKCIEEEKKSRDHLRRSSSLAELTEEAITSNFSKTNICSESEQKFHNVPAHNNNSKEKTKKYRKRRSKSLENRNPFTVQTDYRKNNSARVNINLPSTSGVQRKISSNQQKNNNSRLTIRTGGFSSRKTPINKMYQKTSNKSPSTTFNKRMSSGVDNSHIPAVSQLRRVFSPRKNIQGVISVIDLF